MNQVEAVRAIRATRNKVIHLIKKKDKLYKNLCRKLRGDPDADVTNFLFDYIYNGCGTAHDAWIGVKPADARPKKS